MFRFISFATLAVAASLASAAHARPITVGADSACDFHSLDGAIAAVTAAGKPAELRLARNLKQVLGVPMPVGLSLQVNGGYSQCSDDSALGSTTVRVATPAEGLAFTTASVLRSVRVLAAQDDTGMASTSAP